MVSIVRLGGGYWHDESSAGIAMRTMDLTHAFTNDVVASMCSFNYEYAYIITLIVNELIEDNSVKESIVH